MVGVCHPPGQAPEPATVLSTGLRLDVFSVFLRSGSQGGSWNLNTAVNVNDEWKNMVQVKKKYGGRKVQCERRYREDRDGLR